MQPDRFHHRRAKQFVQTPGCEDLMMVVDAVFGRVIRQVVEQMSHIV